MGYTIKYSGRFNLNKSLTDDQAKFLRDFAATRHYSRAWKEDEENGKWFVDPDCKFEPDFFNDKEYEKVLYAKPYNHKKRKAYELEKWGCADYSEVNPGMPSFYCQWVPTEDMMGIEWDGGEKFYNAKEWLEFIIENYLKPWGYVLNGQVEYKYGENEYPSEFGFLIIKDNIVDVIADEESELII